MVNQARGFRVEWRSRTVAAGSSTCIDKGSKLWRRLPAHRGDLFSGPKAKSTLKSSVKNK